MNKINCGAFPVSAGLAVMLLEKENMKDPMLQKYGPCTECGDFVKPCKCRFAKIRRLDNTTSSVPYGRYCDGCENLRENNCLLWKRHVENNMKIAACIFATITEFDQA